ncbi:MAG: M24 family metallopeptidase [Chryseolinea sp.]
MKNCTGSFLLILLLITAAQLANAQVLSRREQAVIIDDVLDDRLKNLLPSLMRREGIDMWVIVSREYNEDPVIRTMLPATWLAARRTTMLVVFDPGVAKELEYLAVARYDVGNVFKRTWDPEKQPDQWAALGRIITERNPKKIGINKAEHYGHADGLTANDQEQLLKNLNPDVQSRITSAEKLAVSWLETRSEKEMQLYPKICKIAHDIIREGFSTKVISPGITTAEDVVWWYREKIAEMKLDTWFHPSVSIDREGNSQGAAIVPGDLLHVDFGITYLRLNTDTQQHAYILKSGESDAPNYLKKAMALGNQLQDILTSNFAIGKTGNQILSDSRKEAIAKGLTPSIYTHPLGYHGHAAGTTIGQWDLQNGVPETGDYPMHGNTAYSIELNVTTRIDEWKKDIQIKLEEDGFFDEKGKFRYIDGRQTTLILIAPKNFKSK